MFNLIMNKPTAKIYKLLGYIFCISFIISCNKNNEYLIEKGKVGELTANTTVSELSSIYLNDSIVFPSDTANEEVFAMANDAITIYSENGKKKLEIVPQKLNDSLSTIKSVQIFDSKFKTDKGLSITSNFSDINANYMVNNIETTLSSATLFVDELNATIAIDKEDLGLSKFSTEKVSLNQIPETAKIKYFTIWFN